MGVRVHTNDLLVCIFLYSMYNLYMNSNTFVKKVNDFFNSYKAIAILSSVGVVFAIVELVSFFFLGMEINGISFIESQENVELLLLTLFAVTLSLVSLFLGFFIGVANARGSKWAPNLAIISIIISLIINVMAGLWLVVMELSVVLPITFIRRSCWKREIYKDEKYSIERLWPFLLAIGICSGILFFSVVSIWGREIYSFSVYPDTVGSNADRKYIWYLDATVATLGIMGNFSFIFRWRTSYVWWTMSKLPYITCMVANGNLIQVFQMLVWIVVDMGTVLAMTHQLRERRQLISDQEISTEFDE